MKLTDMFRQPASKSVERPSVLIQIRMTDILGLSIDAQLAFNELVAAFKTHPHLRVSKAEFRPDVEGTSSNV